MIDNEMRGLFLIVGLMFAVAMCSKEWRKAILEDVFKLFIRLGKLVCPETWGK